MKCLNLPVCERNGTVCGLVTSVMDLIYGCGGAEGWRSLFDSAMDISDDVSYDTSNYDFSVSKSFYSGSRKLMESSKNSKPIFHLRPKKPIIAYSSSSVAEVSCKMMKKSDCHQTA